MEIVEPQVIVHTRIDRKKFLKTLENRGRVCYKSESRITEDSAIPFVESIVSRQHLTVIEQKDVTVRFICDRGVSHELVRHRLTSPLQESTRYCNYGKNAKGIRVIKPTFHSEESEFWWTTAMRDAEDSYTRMLALGCSPQLARSVLPNSLKTELVLKANLREWMWILRMRTSDAAHPQARDLAVPLLKYFRKKLPEIFKHVPTGNLPPPRPAKVVECFDE